MSGLAARIGALDGAARLALAAVAGAAMALGQPPVSQPLVIFLALPVILWLWDGTGGCRDAFWTGWAAGAGYFAAALFWIIEPFLVDAARHGWMAPFALTGIAGGLALFWAVPFALARRLRLAGMSRVMALAALWTLGEFARSQVLTGFPWALTAYVWSETPVAQSLAWLGPHLLGFLTLLAGLLPGAARVRGAVAAALIVAAAWGGGAWRLAQAVPARDPPVLVRLVQPNAPQELKWRADMQQVFFDRLLAQTRAVSDPMPDVTIWPEAAVPFLLGAADGAQAVAASAVGPQGRLILGMRRMVPGESRDAWFNALAVLGPDGQVLARYDKHHLVPFGEYIPLGGLIERFAPSGVAALAGTGFSAGPGPRLAGVPGLPPFLPLICYEAIFPHEMRAPEGRAGWIVQLTNDAWFGEAAGPYQHFAQSRMRAIEQGLPLARAANTGISAMIDARGQVVAELGLGVEGRLDAPLPGALPPTPYAKYGDWPVWILILIVFGLTYIKLYSGNFQQTRQ